MQKIVILKSFSELCSRIRKQSINLKTLNEMITEKIYKTFAAFCKGENLIKGNVKSHCDGFTYCECKDRLTKKKVIIYFDNEDNCVYYY